MKQDYAINADYNIGDLSTNHSLLLNGKPIEGKTYLGDETTIHVDNNTNVISAIANALIPTGTIVPYVGNTAPDGWLICDGQILENNDTNAKLWNLLHQNSNFRTVSDVRLPDLKGRFIKGVSSDTTQIGKTETSALPNIKAEWPILYYYGHPAYVSNQKIHDKYYSGAVDNFKEFPQYTTAPTLPGCGDTGGGHGLGWKANFDASRSSNIYKDDATEVTPPNIWLNYIIKL